MLQQENIFLQIKNIPQEYSDLSYAIYHPTQNPLISNDLEEYQHFKAVVATFFNYFNDFKPDVKRMEKNFKSLTQKQAALLKYNYLEQRLPRYKFCIQKNAEFLIMIVVGYQNLFQQLHNIQDIRDIPHFEFVKTTDVNKLRITLKQFARGTRYWSSEGQKEREQCYTPILEEFKFYFSDTKQMKTKPKILVPGAGLGRLVYDLAICGFNAQGNEFSYFMLLASNFIMNLSRQPNEFKIYPYINNHLNRQQEQDAFQCLTIPDVAPCQHITEECELSMVAGEFLSVYEDQHRQWDGVATCFFLDTANNIIQYIQTIHSILKQGGIWVNLGPLEYHYAKTIEISIELSWEEIEHVIQTMGFKICKWETRQCTYNQHLLDGKKLVYECVLFTAMKL